MKPIMLQGEIEYIRDPKLFAGLERNFGLVSQTCTLMIGKKQSQILTARHPSSFCQKLIFEAQEATTGIVSAPILHHS